MQNLLNSDWAISGINRKILYILLPVAMMLVHTSCTEWGIFQNKTTTTEEFNQLGEFQEITLDGIFDVEIYQSERSNLFIQATPDQFNHLNIKNNDGQLFVKQESRRAWVSDYQKPLLKIHIDTLRTFENLKPIHLTTIDTLTTPSLKLLFLGELNLVKMCIDTDYLFLRNSLSSTGNITMEGNAGQSRIMIEGSTHLDAKGLKSKIAKVVQYSIADVFVHVNEKLTVDSRASGDVYFTGSPEIVNTDLKSTGRVIPLQDEN
jgi:hypothetical protein